MVRLCVGTACHVKGSENILDTLRKKLGLSGKDTTTPDMLFTVETVSCLGACGLAPVVVVNETVYGQMTSEKALGLLEDIRKKEESTHVSV